MSLIRTLSPSLFLIGWLFSVQALAQTDSITFRVAYLPQKMYQLESRAFMKLLYVFDSTSVGDSALSREQLPQNLDMQMDQLNRSTIQTGQLKSDGTFPFSMRIDTIGITMTQNGEQISMPLQVQGIKRSEGTILTDGTISLDTLIGDNLSPEMKNMHAQTMRSIFSQVVFPNHPMAIGDTFYQTIPMTIPVAGTAAQMNSNLTYVLTHIQGNMAFLTINQDFVMDGDMDQFQMEVTGQGAGKCSYHLQHQFLTSFFIDLEANLLIQIEDRQIETQIKGITSQTVVIEENP